MVCRPCKHARGNAADLGEERQDDKSLVCKLLVAAAQHVCQLVQPARIEDEGTVQG